MASAERKPVTKIYLSGVSMDKFSGQNLEAKIRGKIHYKSLQYQSLLSETTNFCNANDRCGADKK